MKYLILILFWGTLINPAQAIGNLSDTLLLKFTHQKSGFQECILLKDNVSCLLQNGKRIKGQLVSITDSLLAVVGKEGKESFKPSEIVRIYRRAFDSNYHRLSNAYGSVGGITMMTIFGMLTLALVLDRNLPTESRKAGFVMCGLMTVLGILITTLSLHWLRKRSSVFHLHKRWRMEIVPQTPEDVTATQKYRKRQRRWAWIQILLGIFG
jgi:hypothetical protein